MNKLLARLKEEKMLCSFYFNEKFESFSVGVVASVDDEWCMISRVSPNGYFDGFCCRKIDTIIRISIEDNYIRNMDKLIKANGTQLLSLHVDIETDFLRTVLAWLKGKSELCCIELHNFDDLAFYGYISQMEDNLLIVDCIDNDAQHNGKSIIKIDDISAVAFMSEDEEKFKKLV